MLRVVGDRPDIVVAHRKIDAAIAICVSDWAARSQIIPNSVRIIAPVRMIVIEIPRPIADRRALPHGCLLRGHAAQAGQVRAHFARRGGPKRSPVLRPIQFEVTIGTRKWAIRLCASWSAVATLVQYIVGRAYTEADMMSLQHPRPRRPLARVCLLSKSSRSHFIPERELE